MVGLACNLSTLQPTAPQGQNPEAAITPTPEAPTVSLPSTRLLTICLGREPASLFLYADGSAAARSILQAIYDGPSEMRNFQLAPVILEQLPDRNNGQVMLEPVAVEAGNIVSDLNGNLVALAEGVGYLPAGCQEESCAQVYTGQSPVMLDQLVVRFRLRAGLVWSDQAPLTADDSVYAYQVARELYPRLRAELIANTASYQALDSQTVEWRGVPGYRTSEVTGVFFNPLPRHAWGAFSAEALLTAETVNRAPIGWGPYVVEEWTAGDHITLNRNPSYWRAAEGKPAFDRLVFRFISDPEQALNALLAGECDLLDPSLGLETRLSQLNQLQQEGKIRLYISQGTVWEQLVFGIQSLNPQNLPIFQSVEMRQALAYCVDRQRIVDELFQGQATVLNSYLSPQHPLANAQVKQIPYDPAAAGALLERLGWLDHDGQPETPRLSSGVPGLADGTPLQVDLLISNEPEKQRLGEILQQSAQACGFRLNLISLPWEQLLAPGPEGPVFGRNFTLAQFGWTLSASPACFLFTTQEIPGPYPEFPRSWGGANAAGYSNAAFDRACWQARRLLPDDPGFVVNHQQAQAIFAQDLPAIPLFLRPIVAVSRPDFCGLTLEPGTPEVLWNLEAYEVADECQQP